MDELLLALEGSLLAEFLRAWRWAYPLASLGHVMGIALLFGAILPLDLRLLGLWRMVPVALLARVLVPVAGTGLALALLTGPLLFLADPMRYGTLWLFQLKLALIVLACLNIVLVHLSTAWREGTGSVFRPSGASTGLWLGGLASLTLWLLVVLCGRMLAHV